MNTFPARTSVPAALLSLTLFLTGLCLLTATPADAQTPQDPPVCDGRLSTFETGFDDWWSPPRTYRVNSKPPRGEWALTLQGLKSLNFVDQGLDLSSGGTVAVSLRTLNFGPGDTLSFQYQAGADWETVRTWTIDNGLSNDEPNRFSVEIPSLGQPVKIRFHQVTTNYLDRSYLDDICVTAGGALEATVTCLAGNGRIDVNVVNDSDPAEYILRVGTLTPRVRTVQTNTMWRSPVTGRPDAPIRVRLTRDEVPILDQTVDVACDSNQTTSNPEVKILTWCIGNTGMIWAQMANPSPVPVVYVLDVTNAQNPLTPNIRKSTTAAAFGAAFRGISGRQAGDYDVAIEADGTVLHNEVVTIGC